MAPPKSIVLARTVVSSALVLVLVTLSVLVVRWFMHDRDASGFRAVGVGTSGLREYVHERTGILFVRVPGGSFWQGSDDRDAEPQERPRRQSTVSSFLIAKTEVTNREFRCVMGYLPSERLEVWNQYPDLDRLPVGYVSWEEAAEFCRRVELSLPSESQWEYACRAGTDTRFAYGNDLTEQEANFGGANVAGVSTGTRLSPIPAGSLAPNAFGLFDMHGNVAEWCFEQVEPNGEQFAESPGARWSVLRGGAWTESARYSVHYRRDVEPRTHALAGYGFRPVFNLSD